VGEPAIGGGALLVNVGLNWLWIPQYGGLGAAWATLVAYGLAWVLSSFLLPSLAKDLGVMLSQAMVQLPRFAMLLFRQVWLVR
jgi:Na+-driven multidrug efflux pump